MDRLDALDSRVAALQDGQRRLDQRMGAVEQGLLGVNERLDRLGDDTRQRFRLLNERVAGIEKGLAA